MRGMLALGAAALLAACGGAPEPAGRDIDRLDRELAEVNATSPAADPALRSALAEEIMVDHALTRMANADAVRPPPQPLSGAVPPDEPASGKAAEREALRPAPPPAECPRCKAARQAMTRGAVGGGAGCGCASQVAYSAAWANRLPASVPLYPDARVVEAAGADGPGCRLRVVSFTSAAPLQRVLDWYYTRASAAGFVADHAANGAGHSLAGLKAGAAFTVELTPAPNGGTAVDLSVDGG